MAGALGVVFVLFVSAASAGAQALGESARQLAPGSLKFTLYYQGTRSQDLNFSLNSGGTCGAGGTFNPGFPCASSGNVPASLEGGAVLLRATYQPWDSLQYHASVGVGEAVVRVASAAVSNVLTSDRPGALCAVGVKAVLLPDTIVSPAVALDAGVSWQRHAFNELRPAAGAGQGQVRQRLDLYQYQVAMQTSHRFGFSNLRWSVEPYGGVKWLRAHAYLKDLQGGGRIGGMKDTVTPFVGLILPIYEHEALFSEASFVGGVQYAVGLQIRI